MAYRDVAVTVPISWSDSRALDALDAEAFAEMGRCAGAGITNRKQAGAVLSNAGELLVWPGPWERSCLTPKMLAGS